MRVGGALGGMRLAVWGLISTVGRTNTAVQGRMRGPCRCPPLVPHALLARCVNTVSCVVGRGRGGAPHTASHTEGRGRLGIGARPSGIASLGGVGYGNRARYRHHSAGGPQHVRRRLLPAQRPRQGRCPPRVGASAGRLTPLPRWPRAAEPQRWAAWTSQQAVRASRNGASLSHSVQNGQLFPLRGGNN